MIPVGKTIFHKRSFDLAETCRGLLARFGSAHSATLVIAAIAAPILAGLAAPFVFVYFPKLAFVNDLTGGYAVWIDGNKIRDLAVPILAVMLSAILIWPIYLALRVLSNRSANRSALLPTAINSTARPIMTQLLEGVAIVAFGAVLYFTGKSGGSLALVIASHALFRPVFRSRGAGDPPSLEIAIFSLVFSASLPVLRGGASVEFPGLTVSLGAPLLMLIASVALQILFVVLSAVQIQRLRKLVVAINYLAVSVLFLRFIPQLSLPGNILVSTAGNLALALVIVSLSGGVLYEGLTRIRLETAAIGPMIAIACAAILSKSLSDDFTLSADDYHFGESLIPWLSMKNFGGRFMADIVAVHGIRDFFGTAVSEFLFGVNPATFHLGSTYFDILLMFGCGLVIARFVPLALIVLILISAIQFDIILFLAGIVAIARTARIAAWLPVYVALSFLFVFFTIPLGPAAVIASIAPIGTRCIAALRRHEPVLDGGLIACLVGLALILLFRDLIHDQISYLLASSRTNLTIYATPWDQSFTPFDFGNELSRFSWMLLFLVMPSLVALAVYRTVIQSHQQQQQSLLITSLLIMLLLFMLLSLSYSNGRIDLSGGSRPGLFGLIIWPFFVIIVGASFSSELLKTLSYGVSALFIAAIAPIPSTSTKFNVVRGYEAPPPLKDISADVPRMGKGSASLVSVQRTTLIKSVMDALLLPNETYFDATNRNALYYYLGRRPPVPVVSIYNAGPEEFQRRNLQRVKDNLPPVALISADTPIFDNVPIPIRSYEEYRFVVDNYLPFSRYGMVFGVLRSEAARLEKLPKLPSSSRTFTAVNTTDQNWVAGIARANVLRDFSFFVDRQVFQQLQWGDMLEFADGSVRRINGLQEPMVQVSGPLLDPAKTGWPNVITMKDAAERSEIDLWEEAFPVLDLGSLPSAWGRSLNKLSSRMVDNEQATFVLSKANDVSATAANSFRPTGPDPYVSYAVSGVSPQQNGLLYFEVACEMQKSSQIPLEIYWATDTDPLSERTVFRFNANAGPQLVPMDSKVRWNRSNILNTLRIDLADPSSCAAFSVTNLKFYGRRTDDRKM